MVCGFCVCLTLERNGVDIVLEVEALLRLLYAFLAASALLRIDIKSAWLNNWTGLIDELLYFNMGFWACKIILKSTI